jgi:hypothetical protein
MKRAGGGGADMKERSFLCGVRGLWVIGEKMGTPFLEARRLLLIARGRDKPQSELTLNGKK